MRIALTGNPNSGKTTMFNALTGKSEQVGNWAGVTVDKKISPIKKAYCPDCGEILAVDLPGAYSMSPYTSEESVTRQYILEDAPDAIINIVDATNLSRSLFFTTQLLELGIPTVVALNKSDVTGKKKTHIDVVALSKALRCPVIETISVDGEGLKEVVTAAVEQIGKPLAAPYCDGDIDMTDKAAVEQADRDRYSFVNKLVKQVESRKVYTKDKNFNDKIDAVLTNKWAGIPIFAVVMFLVFQISQAWVGPWVADALVAWLETFMEWVRGFVTSPILEALLVDGAMGGAIAVIGFLPLVMVMYFLLALLEDCGYMSRVSVVLDPIFKRVGLSGKSVIPFVMAVGCAVPGVMASRTIRNDRERRATAMLAPFMPCGAKIPIISLFAGTFFNNAGWVSTIAYFAGILLIFLGALLVGGVTGHRGRKSYFIIEIPEYKFPSLWGAFKSMCSRGWAYIVKAATIILLCNTAVQLMQTFTWSFAVAETADVSILASIGRPFAYLLVPVVGVLSWQLAAAAITGFIAKENVVGTLAVCFVGLENLIDTEELALVEGAGAEAAGIFAITKVAALAYMMFNLYSPPCFAAIGAMNAEMKDKKWLFGGIGLQLAVGFTVGYLVNTIGTLIVGGSLHMGGTIGGAVAVAVFAVIIGAMIQNANKQLNKEVRV